MNDRFLKKVVLYAYILLVTATSFSQQTIADAKALTHYNNALNLYNTKAYAAAQKAFATVFQRRAIDSNLKADASYYEAMCAIKLQKPNAAKMVLSFVANNPNSTKKNSAFLNVANYYFANKKTAHALKWYQKVEIKDLSIDHQKELNFKMGYCFLNTNNLTQANKRFLPLINDAKYGNDARYYYGFIAYKQENYDLAETTLKEIADNASYRAEISYYLLDINFKAGKFKQCIKVGLALLPTIEEKLKSNISKIIGESYFNLKEYEVAIPYLKGYQGIKGKWNNTDFYQLGYAYYKQKDFENAVDNFNKIIGEKNAVSQNAYYHLGECYMKLDKKAAALNAFKSASKMSFDANLQEDAALNYAKLSYEEGNPFEAVAEVLQHYLKTYPKSQTYTEINELLVSSFLNQQDYKGALQFLSENKSEENRAFSQEISLYRGIQLFNENNYKEALVLFTEGKKSKTTEISQKSNYWEAETNYNLEDYTNALTKFNALNIFLKSKKIDDFIFINYNIGYCYFKLKEYSKAAESFEVFLSKTTIPEALKSDAFIRLGDSYFALTNYKKAILAYRKAASNSGDGADYATYQIGMSSGFTDENEAKIAALKTIINKYPTSHLLDDALYQLGNTYSSLKDPENAHIAYNRLVEKHPKSIFLSRTLLRQGLLLFNSNSYKASLTKYKQVTVKFPNSPDAIEAVTNARKVYIEEGNLEDYVTWIATLPFINSTNAALENTTFAIAEKKYLENKIAKKTIESLEKYNKAFPEGRHKIKVNYYLADVYFKENEFEKAIPYYVISIDEKGSEYAEDALNKLAQIYLNKNDFETAVPILKRLEEEAYISENILFAQSNLMKGYSETAAYEFAIAYAKLLLGKDKIDNGLENDAKKIIARAAIKTQDFTTAKTYYAAIEKTANGALKAEALYYNAFFKNKQKEYEASNATIQELIAGYTTYKYWAVKSYVIMGENYYALNDIYQATFVLENIIKNFKEFEDIQKDTQKVLNTIKENQAKINNSVTPEKKN